MAWIGAAVRAWGLVVPAFAIAVAGCFAATTSHHEHAFPEHKRASIGWGVIEAARSYEDAWSGNGDLRVGPMETLSGSFAPMPRLKLGIAMHGTGVGFTGKGVLGHVDRWAAAVVGDVGFLSGDDDDPLTHTLTWKASGLYSTASAVLSFGNRRPPVVGKKDILFALSAGPKVAFARIEYQDLDGAGENDWNGTAVDYGGFFGASIERWFFRGSAEASLLRVDRPTAGSREVCAYGGMKLFFSW